MIQEGDDEPAKKKKKRRKMKFRIKGIRNLNKYQDFRELSVGDGQRSNRWSANHSLLRSPRTLSRPSIEKMRLPVSGKLDPEQEQNIKDVNVIMLNRLFEILCRTNKYVPGLTYTYSECSLDDCDFDSDYDYDNNPELLLKQIQHEIKIQTIEEERQKKEEELRAKQREAEAAISNRSSIDK